MSYSATRKNGRTCSNISRKEHCSLKLHLSTCRPRGKTRRRALHVCAHRLRKKKEDNHPKFSGPEGQKVHEKRNPDEVLFSGRSTVLATKLGERLSAHRKEVQSAHCEASKSKITSRRGQETGLDASKSPQHAEGNW